MTPSVPPAHRQGRRSLLYMRGESRLASAWPRILFATLLAVVVTFVEHGLKIDTYSLTPTPFTILGVAISFFLGFRNNTAYTRFWEARTLWGRIINNCRSLTRQILTQIQARQTLDDTAGAGVQNAVQAQVRVLHADMIGLIVGYATALRHHLRDTDPFADLQTRLRPDETAWLKGSDNVPLAILHLLAQRVAWARAQGWTAESDLLILERSLTDLTDAQGGCERIKNTPMPVTYTSLSHRIVTFFCCALPFGLIDTAKLLTPLVVFLVSYAFFGLDVLGEEISDPFGSDPHDLPLPTYAATVEKNVTNMRDKPVLPPPA